MADVDEHDGGASTPSAFGMLVSFLVLATVVFFWFVRGEDAAAAGTSAPSAR